MGHGGERRPAEATLTETGCWLLATGAHRSTSHAQSFFAFLSTKYLFTPSTLTQAPVQYTSPHTHQWVPELPYTALPVLSVFIFPRSPHKREGVHTRTSHRSFFLFCFFSFSSDSPKEELDKKKSNSTPALLPFRTFVFKFN